MKPETCWICMGAGAWHDCGEDICCCLDPEPNEYCNICHGEGLLPIDDPETPTPKSGGEE